MKFNPFSRIIKTKTAPFSEIFRHDLFAKMSDTFFVFFGDLEGPGLGIKNLGIIDYLSLGILSLPAIIDDYCYEEEDTSTVLNTLAYLNLFIFYIPSFIVRYILSAACAIILSPFVAIAHIFTSFFSKNDFETALTLQVSIPLEDGQESYCSLKKALNVIHEKYPHLTTHSALHQDKMGTSGGNSSSNDTYYIVKGLVDVAEPIYGHGPLFFLPRDRPINDPAQNKAFSALLRLNLFRYTTTLEQLGMLHGYVAG